MALAGYPTRRGGRASRGTRTSRPTRSTRTDACWSSTRWACPARSRRSRPSARRRSSSPRRGMSATRRAWSSGSGAGLHAAARQRAVPHGHVRHHRRAGRRRQSRRRLVAPRGERRGSPYSAGDRPPFGADVFPGHKTNDTVLWVESQRAVISGDTLVDFGQGLEINERWLPPGVTRKEVAEGCARCSSCRSSTCSRRTAGRSTGRPRARARLTARPDRMAPGEESKPPHTESKVLSGLSTEPRGRSRRGSARSC